MPVAAARYPVDLAREVAALPAWQLLLQQGDTQVWWAQAGQLDAVLNEIGRLRELTFRAVGEGSGKITGSGSI